MRLDRSELSKAVQTALSLGAVAAVGIAGTAFAQTATTTTAQNNQKQPQTLQTIVVTGSHIRRVDLETSNPVTVVTSQQIKASGKLTLGDIVQDLPSVAGAAANPQVNNGGGFGASGISLRGLGSSRTLILIDGHRAVNGDVNSIPAELVERIEILKDGASSVYGSDAIGGVVNFIMKKNYQGAEFGVSYGISDRSDGERKGYHFTFGQTSDKGSIIAGLDYNKFDGIQSGARDYSKCAESLSGGTIQGVPCSLGDGSGGSLASITGLVTAPDFANCPPIPQLQGAGGGTYAGSPGKFRCFNTATDLFNYQAVNLVETPQERTNAYFLANYNLTDNVQAYLDVFINRTHANSQVAPMPVDMYQNLTMAPGQPYNPFPGAVGGGVSPTGNPQNLPFYADYAFRGLALGDRVTENTTETNQILAGLKGSIGNTGWQWNVGLNYGHVGLKQNNHGYLNYAAFQASGDLNADCATNSVDGCVNIFDQSSPETAKVLSHYLMSPFYNSLSISRRASAGANGPLFTLPAGQVQLAVGVDYDKEYSNFTVDPVAIANSAGRCGAPPSACASPINGAFNYKEAYAELFIPVLKDMPFARSLNVNLGDRYSKYSLAGSTNNYKIGLEWKPIDDLLLRGTVAKVFREGSIGDYFAGAGQSFDPYKDPCAADGSDDVPGGPHYVFCQHANGAAVNGTQIATIASGAATAGFPLAPEMGKSFDFGAVYSPHFIPGLSLTADLWRVVLHDNITRATGNTAAAICYFANDPTNPYCSSIAVQGSTGRINTIRSPVTNLGTLWVKGLDVSADYQIPQVSWLPGQFSVSVLATYLSQYDNDPSPGLPGDQVIHVAGHYNDQYGMFPRWRGLASLNWQDGPWQARYQLRYIGKYTVGSADPSQATSCDAGIQLVECHYGAWLQSDVSAGYTIEPINTTIQVGVDNLFDKQPNIMFQNNTLNANTDPSTFDLIGRYYWANATVKF